MNECGEGGGTRRQVDLVYSVERTWEGKPQWSSVLAWKWEVENARVSEGTGQSVLYDNLIAGYILYESERHPAFFFLLGEREMNASMFQVILNRSRTC